MMPEQDTAVEEIPFPHRSVYHSHHEPYMQRNNIFEPLARYFRLRAFLKRSLDRSLVSSDL